MNYITLNNGVEMPILGYGVYQVSREECERCVLDAFKGGPGGPQYKQVIFNYYSFNDKQ